MSMLHNENVFVSLYIMYVVVLFFLGGGSCLKKKKNTCILYMCGISVGYLRLCEGGVESIAPGKRNGL